MKKLFFTILTVFISLVHAQTIESYRVTKPNLFLSSLDDVYDFHFLMFDGDYGTLTVFRHNLKDSEGKIDAFNYVRKHVFPEYVLYEYNTKVRLKKSETTEFLIYFEERTNWKNFFYNNGTAKTKVSSTGYKITYNKETSDKKEEQVSETDITQGKLNPWEKLNLSIVKD